jgi:glycosyltransferase involved in cell wall biosynthesis
MPASRVLSTLHLSTARSWRGGENQLLLLARGLVERGHQALVVAPKGAPLVERAAEAGLPVRVLTLHGELDAPGMWRLARLLREVRPDILHLHDGHSVLPGQVAARVRSAMGVIAHRRTSFKVRGRWKYAGRVDRVVAISSAVRECLLAAGVPEQRVAVVYSGLEFPETLARESAPAQALRRELGLPENAILAAHAAALTREKRQMELLSAVRTCVAEGMPLHLAVAGTGELEAELKAATTGVLAGRVHWLGFRRDLRALWAAADLAVFCSEAEGLCTALVEAQGAGLPAVVTHAGGMAEVVSEGETGLVVPVGGLKELSGALTRLAKDVELRRRMGAAASRRAREIFSANVMVDGILRVYQDVLKTKTRMKEGATQA